jgi:hypothetical protein
MLVTRRHQAVHDLMTHTTVQIRDLDRARPGDYHTERVEPVIPGMASRFLRITMIVIWSALWYIGLVIVAVLIDSQLARELAGLLVLGGVPVIIVAGWKGRLPGARHKRPPPSPIEPQGDGTVVHWRAG